MHKNYLDTYSISRDKIKLMKFYTKLMLNTYRGSSDKVLQKQNVSPSKAKTTYFFKK